MNQRVNLSKSQGEDLSSPWDCGKSVTNVVLPNPVGAEMRDSLRCRLRLSCFNRHECLIGSERSCGMKNSVTRIGDDINGLYSTVSENHPENTLSDDGKRRYEL